MQFLIILAITACCNGLKFSSVVIALIIHFVINAIARSAIDD